MEKYFKYGFFIAIFTIIGLLYKGCDDAKKINDAEISSANLNKALADTLHHFQTKEGDWGVEKRTIQAELSTLKDKNLVLTDNQKKLVKQIEDQNKTSQTIAAALIQLTAKVEGLSNEKPSVVTDSTVQFVAVSPDFEYDLTVFNVKPIDLKIPKLTLNRIAFPNTQTINFHWKDDRKEGYPVSFNVINTNPYFKVHDIQSYVIPELKREKVKPTFWQKVGQFGKSRGGKLTIFGVGVGVGAIVISALQN